MTSAWSDSLAFSAAALQWHWRGRTQFSLLQNGCGDAAQLLQTWNAWQQDADAPQRLHYLIIDPQLPERAQLARWQPTLPVQLLADWPPQLPGYHRILLAQGRFTLTLIAGDIAASLPQLEARIDFFLLRRDPLWTPILLKWLGRLAAPQARLLADDGVPLSASALQQLGFVSEQATTPTPAQFAPRWQTPGGVERAMERRAIVIGAGLAGSAVCESLAVRGWRSGVFEHAHQGGQACGVLQVARDAAQAAAFEAAAQQWRYPADYAQWLTADQASARLGRATGSGWFFPKGGWLQPAAVCAALLAACGDRLQRHFGRGATSLRRVHDEWQVCTADGRTIAQAPVLILANGTPATQFAQAAGLPLQAIRGQVSHLPAASLPALPFVLCGDGYLTGAVAGLVSVGASYDQDHDPALRRDSHLGNLDKLVQLLREPSLLAHIDAAPLAGRVGFRCVSADRLPLVGALPDLAALSLAGEVSLREVPRQPQLHGLLGYASRGLIWAPLAAELVACH